MKNFRAIQILVFSMIFSCFSLVGQSQIDSLISVSKTKSDDEKPTLYLEIANAYLKNVAPDSAITYAKQALKLAHSKNNFTDLARSYCAIGEGYQKKNELKLSTEYYLKGIHIAEKNNLLSVLGSACNGLGITYYFLDNMERSEFYIRKGADAKFAAKDYTFYSVMLTNLASLYFYKGQYQDAIEILKSAEKRLIKTKEEHYLASIYNSIGANYQLLTPESDSAEIYYKKSIDYAIKYTIVDNLITGYHNLGERYFKRNNYQQAIHYLKKAEIESKKSTVDIYKRNIYTTLSEIYETMGDYQNSLNYKKKEFEINNSILSSEKQKTINELEIKYETAKKEQEIQAQKEEIQIANLNAEKTKNRLYLILFSSLLVFLIAGFIFVFLQQRKKSIRQLEQEKLKILENIVHDIRTPVTLIKGPLQLLKNEFSTHQKHAANFDLIERNSEKLVLLVNELLDASKLDKGNYKLETQTGEIDLFIESILETYSSESVAQQISIEYIPNDSESVHTYFANALEKIIINLVGNSLKYCPPNSSITVKSSIEAEQLNLTISDNGNGIHKKEQKKIFERFYRRQEDKSKIGTGIGLSLVKDLVDMIKGSIELKSDVGHGAAFFISIPIELAKTSSEVVEIDSSKFQLLLCEDDPDIVRFVCGFLDTDFAITVATNGEDGIGKFNEILPDIVLSDVMMPVKDGIELLQEIKSNVLTNHTPVVLFSAKSSLESRLKGLKYGADAYISKPFNPEELRLILQNLVNTIQSNKQAFQESVKSEKAFEERVKSTNEYVNKAIAFVVSNIDNYDYSVNELAEEMCISRSQLHRKLSALTGFSTTNFIKMIRLEKSKDLLRSNWGNVTEVAYACGFNSQSYFTKSFTEYFGESPSKI